MKTNASNEYAARLKRLRGALIGKKLDAFLVSNPQNVYYLTGFRSSAARAVVDAKRAAILTDGRYKEAAEKALPGWEIRCLPAKDPTAWERSFWEKRGYRRIGFEGTASYNETIEWRRHTRPSKLVEAGAFFQIMRLFKDASEITCLREAARLADVLMAKTFEFLKPGLTEIEIARFIRRTAEEIGGEGESFDAIVALGPNTSRPHHHPSSRRLRRGDLVMLDLGVRWKGYCSDITRMASLGPPSKRALECYAACLEAQETALAAVRPGAAAKAIDALSRASLKAHKLDEYFVHGLGHGVGLDIHEEPRLNMRSRDILEEGMAVTVEPGVYLPNRLGIRIEDLVIVTSKGMQILSKSPKALLVL